MRYINNIEKCDCCGKTFNGTSINIHGSYEYIKHTNFSNNIKVMFYRTKELMGDKRVDRIVEEFFEDGNSQINKNDAIEFLECLKHYKYSDNELLQKVCYRIQEKIDIILE